MRQADPMSIFVAELGNSMAGRRPGLAIEESEASGQAALCATSKSAEAQLPRDMRDCRTALEAAGVVFLGDCADDRLFLRVRLPAGWEIKRTDHNMWTSLCDAKGRKRASIFYKAVFYDRGAHMSMDRRYRIESFFNDDHRTCAVARVMDQDTVLFTSERLPIRSDDDRYGTPIPGANSWERSPSKRDLANKQCSDWLAEHFPQWQDVNAYWD